MGCAQNIRAYYSSLVVTNSFFVLSFFLLEIRQQRTKEAKKELVLNVRGPPAFKHILKHSDCFKLNYTNYNPYFSISLYTYLAFPLEHYHVLKGSIVVGECTKGIGRLVLIARQQLVKSLCTTLIQEPFTEYYLIIATSYTPTLINSEHC